MEINFKYIVPECMYVVLGESMTICLELVDEFIKKAVSSHVLEGFLVVNEVYKARPKYPQRAYPNMGMRFLFEQEKLNVLKERRSSNKALRMQQLKEKEKEKEKEKKDVKKFKEFRHNIKNMKDKDVVSVGTNNINKAFGNNTNLFDTKSMVSRGTNRTNSKIYNFFDKKSEREFLKNDD